LLGAHFIRPPRRQTDRSTPAADRSQ
jgi:hypothetical protein